MDNGIGWLKKGADFLNEASAKSNVLVGLGGSFGIAGFLFDIVEDETVDLSSMITDYYVESGSPAQDHIALRPERITVRGYQGEYKNIVSDKPTMLEKGFQKLTTLQSYLPVLSSAASNLYNDLKNFSIEKDWGTFEGAWEGAISIGNMASNLFEAYSDINIPQNEQQKAFIYFEALRNARVTFTVQTPFRTYTDMAIESIRARQGGDTRDSSSFDITFKKIRFVTTDITSLEEKPSEKIVEQAQGRLTEQVQKKINAGLLEKFNGGVSTTMSALKSAIPNPLNIPNPFEAQLRGN